MRSPLLVIGVEHDHLSDLGFNKPVQDAIGHVDGVFLYPVDYLHCMLDCCIGALTHDPVHDALVDLVWKDYRCQDVPGELLGDFVDY